MLSNWLRPFSKRTVPSKKRGARKAKTTRPPRCPLAPEALERRDLPAGTWTPLAHLAPSTDGTGTAMLMTDGSVMVIGGDDTTETAWYKLTPDATGGYINGTWSNLAPMNEQRLFFGSNILPSGQAFVIGGEYPNFSNTSELYDPVANTWTYTSTFPQSSFGDDPTQVLANGQILCGFVSGPQTYLFDPVANTWTQTGTKLRNDQSDEECWVKLPDGSILSYDIFSSISSGVGHAQRYIPSTGTWVDAGTVPVTLTSDALGAELGPAFLLPDGRVLQFGANSNTAIYTPSTNTWVAGPVLPNGDGMDDAPGCEMVNGHILVVADTPLFSPPAHVYDVDPVAGTVTQVTLPAALANSLNQTPAFDERMLALPSGDVLFTDSTNQLWDYNPNASPQDAWRPTVTSVTPNGPFSFTLTGTQLNGLSEGAAYGDDVEMSSNYPIVQLTDQAGTVFFAKTTNWTSQVASGATPVTTDFQLPAGFAQGQYTLTVIANGISSAPFSFNYKATSSISGIVYDDLNADGVQQSGEPGLSGWTVYLDTNNNGKLDSGEFTTTSDVNGNYTFSNLPGGTFRVREVVQPGWGQTSPNPGDVVTTNNNDTVQGGDFGNFQVNLIISGTVYNDTNGDGMRLGMEPGLPGWTVYLDNNNDGILDAGDTSTTSDATGAYTFSGLGFGTFRVREVVKPSWIQTQFGPDIIPHSGQNTQNVNLGDFLQFNITGKVYNDLNGNGMRDGSGEPGLGAWVLYLDNNNDGKLDSGDTSVTATPGGNYSFTNLGPGTLRLREVLQPGWTQTETPALTQTGFSGQNLSSDNFGNFQLLTLSGTVFSDLDGDGVQQVGEPGAPGWVLNLFLNGSNTSSATATSDANGNYSFTGVGPGTFRVREVAQAGWQQTSVNPADLVTTSGQDASVLPAFGNFGQITISGTLFNDVNGNGVADSGDGGLQNWVVDLISTADNSTAASATTNASGQYSFTGVGRGTYRVREVVQAGWLQTSSNPADIPAMSGQNVSSGEDFGSFQLISISGQVFQDVNGNGVQDAGDTGLQGRVVDLLNAATSATVASATTDSSGNYSFTGVTPGTYRVREVVPAGWLQTSGTPPDVTALSGQNVATGQTFGTFQQISLSGQAFNDLNGNGVQDSGDTGLQGWVVDLFQNGGTTPLASATTAANGSYSFSNLGPGTYRVREVVQGGWLQTSGNPADVTAQSGQNVSSGLTFADFQTLSISGQVFADQNGNGSLDAGDTGLSGWRLNLLRASDNSLVASATTDANGNYTFTGVAPGTYRVREVLKSGFTQTSSNPADVAVQSGTSVGNVRFGDFGLVTVSGKVFQDVNGNGVQDAGDTGLQGWVLTLSENGVTPPQFSATTAANGSYSFTGLGAGSYRLREVAPSGWTQTTGNPADFVAQSSVNVGGANFGNFLGAGIQGQLFEDVAGTGVFAPGDPVLSGWTVFLDSNGNGVPDGTEPQTTTDSSGSYSFSNLGPGTYAVREVVQPGYAAVTPPPNVTVQSGVLTTGVDFPNFRLASISGEVFRDSNGNGVLDAGDTGLGGVTVFLDRNGDGVFNPGEPSTVTSGSGTYQFSGLGAGTYAVRLVTPTGSVQTTANPAAFTLGSGQNDSGVNLGLFQKISLSGEVFADNAGTGAAGQPGVAGLTVFLDSNGNGVLDTGEPSMTTNATGQYSFTNLGPGTYRVRLQLPTGTVQTTANPADVAAQSGVNVSGLNVGTFQVVSLSGQVFNDTVGGGAAGGQAGLSGWTVFLDSNGNGVLDAGEPSTVTDVGGFYSFGNLGAGTYRVRLVNQPGWVRTTTDPTTVGVHSGQNVSGQNFGVFHVFSLSGQVFLDSSGSGAGGAGLAGATVFLDSNGNGVLDAGEVSVGTDGAGHFTFSNLGPGTYTVRLVLPTGTQATTPISATVTGHSGQNVGGVNFGVFSLVTLGGRAVDDAAVGGTGAGLAGVGVTLFRDANGNGVYDAGVDPQVAATVTGADGSYSFANLGPGAYLVKETNQAGTLLLTPAGGTYAVTVQGGVSVTNLNFSNLTGANAIFVYQLYGDLLGRQPDAPGAQSWVAVLNGGGTRTQVVQGFQSSSEYKLKVINDAYFKYLGRGADPTGIAAALAFQQQTPLYTGATLASDPLLVMLLSSDEYFLVRGQGSNAGFLTALYQDVLGRAIDPTGAAAFGGALASGASRGAVVRAVLQSGEAATVLVQGYFEKYLHRAGDPSGLATFTGALAQGTPEDAVIAAFVESDEYYNRR